MSNHVSWNLQVAINDGSQDAFKALMEEMVAATRNEPGTLGYEWFISEDGRTCHINERYQDSAAAMEHITNFGANFAERFMSMIAPVSFSVYGDAGDDVRGALAGIGAVHFAEWGGFFR